MKVTNTHKRIINQPKQNISPLLKTLSAKDDKVWPKQYWPAIKFENGLSLGAVGGHGIIKYVIENYNQGESITFRFLKPKGFNGIHKFDINTINETTTEIKHSIDMETKGLATLQWMFVIRWLHDALIENAFDCVENNFLATKKFTKWNAWVHIWRFIFKTLR